MTTIVSRIAKHHHRAASVLRTPNIGFAYCGDHIDDYGIIYLQGANGKLANMDTDCDGDRSKNDDGRCDDGHSVQSATAMRDYVSAYKNGVPDLNPFVHDYVVFGNSGDKDGWITFDPRDHGMKPLSVMAVVCNNKLVRISICFDVIGDVLVIDCDTDIRYLGRHER